MGRTQGRGAQDGGAQGGRAQNRRAQTGEAQGGRAGFRAAIALRTNSRFPSLR